MFRRFKFRLYPNATQTKALEQSLETHRRLYNQSLAERKDAWSEAGISLSFGQQCKLRAAERNHQIAAEASGEVGPHYLAHVSAVSMRDTLKRLDRTFQTFFRRVKANQYSGYPRFRGRDRYDSIPFDNYNQGIALHTRAKKPVLGDMPDDAPLRGHTLKMFGVGSIRVKLHRPIKGKIKTTCVKRKNGKWYVVFSCDLGDVQIPPSDKPALGIDVGLTHFLTDSNGETEENPRYLKAELPELRRRQRAVSRKKKGSKNRKKAVKHVATLHERVANLRREHHHQVAGRLVSRAGFIAAESLNVQGMLGNRRLSRAIGDAAWASFLNVLRSKAESAGAKIVAVDARNTSQSCSACGEIVPKTIFVRVHDCPKCGLVLDRDVNAARNILSRALSEQARSGPAGEAKASNEGVTPRRPRSSGAPRNARRGCAGT